MASSLIISWHIDGDTMEIVPDFIFLGSKISKDSDCSHKIKRHLPLGRKAMTNLNSILRSREITLPTKIHIIIHLSKSIQCTRQKVNPNANYGTLVKNNFQYWFINCNKWTTLLQDVYNRGNWTRGKHVRVFRNSVYFLLSFSVNLKLLF